MGSEGEESASTVGSEFEVKVEARALSCSMSRLYMLLLLYTGRLRGLVCNNTYGGKHTAARTAPLAAGSNRPYVPVAASLPDQPVAQNVVESRLQ